MNFLGNQIKEFIKNGYIQKEEKRSFPVTRTIRISAYPFRGSYYFKTRDIALLLGMKQPFDFVKVCRKTFGEESILQGEITREFRDEEDNDRATYISAENMKKYLIWDESGREQKYAPGMYTRVLDALELYLSNS